MESKYRRGMGHQVHLGGPKDSIDLPDLDILLILIKLGKFVSIPNQQAYNICIIITVHFKNLFLLKNITKTNLEFPLMMSWFLKYILRKYNFLGIL